jgi:hypothetical protein
MKKIALIVFTALSSAAFATSNYDLASEIPEMRVFEGSFQKVDNVAQYKFGDWSEVVGIARNVSRTEALRIANENPVITFFFYTKGHQMVLETQDGNYRVFSHGDAVFFKGQPWWGEAKNLADGYVRHQN